MDGKNNNQSYPLGIGARYWRETPHYWYSRYTGEIDELRIYNRALSEPEIQELYNEGSTPIPLTGDLNNDGAVNIQDIVASINSVLEDGEIIHGADCNDDGLMNIQDVVCTINIVLNDSSCNYPYPRSTWNG